MGEETNSSETVYELLLSQLKPLLQSHWHSNFEECGLGYLSEDGTFMRLKKMKHLINAVLRWRNQCVAWRSEANLRDSVVDKTVSPCLELVPSRRHNDLVLRFANTKVVIQPTQMPEPCLRMECKIQASHDVPETAKSEAELCSTEDGSSNSSRSDSADLEREIAMLRAENNALRNKNKLM